MNNNGIAEVALHLTTELNLERSNYPNGYLSWEYIWDKLEGTCIQYINKCKKIFLGGRIFVCITIVGCKGVITQSPDIISFYTGKIDRNVVVCNPVCIENIEDEDASEWLLKKLYIEYLLSIGVKRNEKLMKYINEIYQI
jgi:hypothetical protein